MERFFLSRNTNFEFELFGFQHMILIFITVIGLILIYKFRFKINNLNEKQIKKIRYTIISLILINMLLYRGSYIYYGVYDIKKHLSLYYCHIVNYLFVFCLIINYKPMYKLIYILVWIGSFWTVLFPDISGGIDCFIFYCSFISHNLVLLFITFMICKYKLKLNLKNLLYCFVVCVIIFVVTYVINYDFGTDFNSPYSILKDYINIYGCIRYLLLLLMGGISSVLGYFFNKLCCR